MRYPDVDLYLNEFDTTDRMFETFITYCYEEIDSLNKNEMKSSMEWIHLQFKAILARSLFTPDAYFKVYNQGDDILQKATAILKDKTAIKAYLRTEKK